MFCLEENSKYHRFLNWVGHASMFDSYEQHWTGTHMLLIATLYDALVILSKPHLKGEENQFRYYETQEWIRSEEELPFTYLWICAHLHLDPQRLRKEIQRGSFLTKERRRRRARQEAIR